MTLNWIGTRTQDDGAFCPAGLGSGFDAEHDDAEHDDAGLLTHGSLLIEAEIRPSHHPVNLLRFAALSPWASGLTICLEPDGTVRLMMRQGSRHLETALKTTLGMAAVTAHITFTWDAPARRGDLSVHLPDYGKMWRVSVLQPFPLAMRDAKRIVCAPEMCTLDEGVGFAAIADAPCPQGPMPGLSGMAAIDTPDGQKLVRDIAAGDFVSAQGTRPNACFGPATPRYLPLGGLRP